MLTHIRGVIPPGDIARIRELLGAGDYEDGRATASGEAGRVKRNLQLERQPALRKQIDEIVLRALSASEAFAEIAFPKTVAPPTYNRYDPGMFYGDHVDAPFLAAGRIRADLSLTIFLSDPASYDGGELVVVAGASESRAKCPAGDAVTYPTTSLHRVDPVTRGSRLAAVSWIQSYVPDQRHREILWGLGEARRRMDALAPGTREADLFRNSLFNLVRLWWQP